MVKIGNIVTAYNPNTHNFETCKVLEVTKKMAKVEYLSGWGIYGSWGWVAKTSLIKIIKQK